MKKFVKVINVNDGKRKIVQNGDWIYIDEYPVMEKIIETFLNHDWSLLSITPTYSPAIQQEGVYNFYMHGSLLCFEKTAEDEEENDGEEILEEALDQIIV